MNIQKRGDRHTAAATAYWIDLEAPILIFDTTADALVEYADLSIEEQDMLDVALDDFE